MTDRCVCLACLSKDNRMCSILNTQLPEFYEKLANIQLSEATVPKTICYICYSQLKKCYKFMEMSQKAAKILTYIHGDGRIEKNQESEVFELKNSHNLVKTILETISVPSSCGDKQEASETSCKGIINAITEEIHGTKAKDVLPYMQELKEIDEQIDIEEEIVTVKEELMTVESQPNTSAHVEVTKVSLKKEITQSNLKGQHYLDVPEGTMLTEDNKVLTLKKTYEKKGHKKGISKEKNHVCISCGKAFTYDYYLQRHMVTHTGEKQFACKTCDKKFSQNGHLVQHMRLHTGEKLYVCDICCKAFSHRYNFKVHMTKHSASNEEKPQKSEKSHKCELCTSSFYNKGELQRHIRSHTGEKPFICNFCDAKFSQKGHLREHIRTHTAEKPSVCNFCKLAFSQKYNLNNHLAVHTGGRLYPCTYPRCHKSFQTKTLIANHLRVHTGERPFACDKCNKTYKQKGHLTTHISVIHAKEEIENDLLAATRQ